jgi:hypothetical protein
MIDFGCLKLFKTMFNPHFGWLLPMFSGLATLRPR